MEYTIRTMRQLGISLKDARKSAGLTQVEAARDFKILQKTVSLLENNPGKCTIESLLTLLNAIGYEMKICPKGTSLPDLEW